MKTIGYLLLSFFILTQLSVLGPGCAQIGSPTGGPKDTLAPRLVSANPALRSVNVKGNRITLNFNEYVEVKDVQNNVLVSPFPKSSPIVDYKLRSVTVKLRDTLKPNTTYAINFGNAIVDIHEGNPYTNFTYVFSTGPVIDSLELSGRVLIAETGRADSTLVAILYRNADDSAVQKRRPDYVANIDGKGDFKFVNLPAGEFRLYALKDGDGGKTYNARFEQFAFSNTPVIVSAATPPVTLYASALEKDTRGLTPAAAPKPEKRLRYTVPAQTAPQDLLNDLEINFNNPIRDLDANSIRVTDTNNNRIPAKQVFDSTRKKLSLQVNWVEDQNYRLLIDSAGIRDSAGNRLAKMDTIRFKTKKETDYSNIILRFTNLDLSKQPVLLFFQGDTEKFSFPLLSREWSKKMFTPGEYELRILYDTNGNGKWDAGDYSKKLQPEIVVPINQKISIRANWDNEREIKL